jgi:hypothetical protein
VTKKNPLKPKSALQKRENPTKKKNEQLGEEELNKVTGGMRKAGGDPSSAGKEFLRFK